MVNKSLFVLALASVAFAAAPACPVADRNNIAIYNTFVKTYAAPEVQYFGGIKEIPSSSGYLPLPNVPNLPDLNITIPDAIKPPAGSDVVLFALKIYGVRIYQCEKTALNPDTYGWPEQVSSGALYRDTPSNLSGKAKVPVAVVVFNPSISGRAIYGAPQKPQSAFQVEQQNRVPGATSNDLTWELTKAVTHLYEPGPFNSIYDFRKVLYHNRVLTNGGAAPNATLCSAANVGEKVKKTYNAWIIFYGAADFTCPLI
ncbi:hypothetical protein HK096_011053 [Nowakowskiella sp. JEL0078]|nr:hypothetical protein HK096_011053 [Nowakowskiella sp. JEL0078]